MGTETQIIFAITFYKLMSLFVGTIFAYMGYKLFMAGVWGEAGDVQAQFKENKLLIKRAAPGTFFVLFGTIVVCFTIFKGLEFKDHGSTTSHENVIEIIEEKNNDLPQNLPF